MTWRRGSLVSNAALALCVSLLTGASAPVSAWSVRRSMASVKATTPQLPPPALTPPLPPLVAFSEPLASGVRPLRATTLQSGAWVAPPGIAAAGPFTSTGGALHWKIARTRPDRARQVVVFQENDPSGRDALHAAFWDGAKWDDGSGTPFGDAKAFGRVGVDGLSDFRGFDAAYEQKSGELLVVAGVNTDETVKYWVHGTSGWNTSTLLQGVANNIQDPFNIFDWVRLAPMPGTNRIGFLGVANDPTGKDSAAIEAMVWDGDTHTWGSKYVLSFPTSAELPPDRGDRPEVHPGGGERGRGGRGVGQPAEGLLEPVARGWRLVDAGRGRRHGQRRHRALAAPRRRPRQRRHGPRDRRRGRLDRPSHDRPLRRRHEDLGRRLAVPHAGHFRRPAPQPPVRPRLGPDRERPRRPDRLRRRPGALVRAIGGRRGGVRQLVAGRRGRACILGAAGAPARRHRPPGGARRLGRPPRLDLERLLLDAHHDDHGVVRPRGGSVARGRGLRSRQPDRRRTAGAARQRLRRRRAIGHPLAEPGDRGPLRVVHAERGADRRVLPAPRELRRPPVADSRPRRLQPRRQPRRALAAPRHARAVRVVPRPRGGGRRVVPLAARRARGRLGGPRRGGLRRRRRSGPRCGATRTRESCTSGSWTGSTCAGP